MAGAACWWWKVSLKWGEACSPALWKHGPLPAGCSWQSVLLPAVTFVHSTYEPCTCLPSSDINWIAISLGPKEFWICKHWPVVQEPTLTILWLLCFNPGFGSTGFCTLLHGNHFLCLQPVRGRSSFLWPWHYGYAVESKRRRKSHLLVWISAQSAEHRRGSHVICTFLLLVLSLSIMFSGFNVQKAKAKHWTVWVIRKSRKL